MKHPWSTAEQVYLRDHYATMTVREIAAVMGRSASSIRGRVTVLELEKHHKPPQPKPKPPKPVRRSQRKMPDGVRDWLLGAGP